MKAFTLMAMFLTVVSAFASNNNETFNTVIIKDAQATKIAEILNIGIDEYATYATGTVEISCSKMHIEENYTCVVKNSSK